MKKAIVTGGGGFIGSHMVDLLLKKNFKVVVIDNFTGGHINNLSQHKKNKKLKIIKKDINNLSSYIKNFSKTHYVFHFAGIGDIVPSINRPLDYLTTNIYGTIKILEACRKYKIKKFVYAASSSCYGMTKKNTNEKYPINNKHPYALSKYLGEKSVLHWGKIYKVPVNSIRIFNAYGPRVRTTGAYGAAIGVFFKQKLANKPLTIVGNGKQTRDFAHVKDVVRAFYLAAISKYINKIYNLGSGRTVTVNKLADYIGGKKIFIPERPGEPKSSSANISKIKKDLNWKPKISFEEGIKNLLKDINKWKDAPLWTPIKIKRSTKNWFKYIR
jgi:UDP-glucose 4-epimerase